jgi:hypothetical protein
VRRFAIVMERELVTNDHKGDWHGCSVPWLLSEMTNHKRALQRQAVKLMAATAPEDGDCPERDDLRARILDDAADVANFAMMIADVCEAL